MERPDTAALVAELHALRRRNAQLQSENAQLRARQGLAEETATPNGSHSTEPTHSWDGCGHGLTQVQVSRYSRQMILPSFGVEAQARLCKASVLVVGAGGLGSPAALYLAAHGVGRLGIVDRDAVELSNLHRQVIHAEADVGRHKALSAAAACRRLNSTIQVEAHVEGLTSANAVALVERYDVIVDATDNAPARYLVSDACAVTGRPLVSGAALGTEGQLTVYCHGPDGPCYRCLFPEAPVAGNCARCSDTGVLGAAPGVIGTLQALEAVKLAAHVGAPLSRTLLLFDALAGRFTAVKLRAKMAACVACGPQPSIMRESIPSYNYMAFTGQPGHDGDPPSLRLLEVRHRVAPAQLASRLRSGNVPMVVDVRPASQFAMAHLPGSISCPYDGKDEAFKERAQSILQQCQACKRGMADAPANAAPGLRLDGAAAAIEERPELLVVCRRGNDSQIAVRLLHALGVAGAMDLEGGLKAWAQHVPTGFPAY